MGDERAAQPGPVAAPGSGPAAAARASAVQPRQVRVRRAPRYRAFTLTGVLLGLLIAAVLALAGRGGDYSVRTALTYLGLGLGLVGGLLGAAAAVLLERRRG